MSFLRESFVVWIEAAESAADRLVGSVEHTRTSERLEFGSAVELVRILEHGRARHRGLSERPARDEESPR